MGGGANDTRERVVRVMVRQRRFWWVACCADETLAEIDLPTYFRSRTRDGAIAKVLRRFGPKPSPWETIEIPAESRNATYRSGQE